MNLVTIFRSFSPAEAQLIRSMLEAAGIPAHIVGELSALSVEGYSLTTGGVRVQVPEDRAEEAKALIASKEGDTPESG